MNKIIDELNESNLKRITHIIAVLNSCETFVQVENTFNWGAKYYCQLCDNQ